MIKNIVSVLLLIFGNFLIVFGTNFFLHPADIVAGGSASIGKIISHLTGVSDLNFLWFNINLTSLVVWLIYTIFFIISIIFLKFSFNVKTLFSTFIYPFFWSFVDRFRVYFLGKGMFHILNNEIANIMLFGILSGLIVGIGLSFTFISGGSSGGLDVLAFILAKYANLKESFSFLIIDSTILILGFICFEWIKVVSGICSIIISSTIIHFVYVKSKGYKIKKVE